MMNFFMFGKAGSGKDTTAKIIEELFRVRSLALADEVRKEYTRFTGNTDYRQNRKKLIQIGEGYKQIYGPDVWCQLLIDRVSFLKEAGEYSITDSFLIRDGRYEHEYDFFVNKRKYIPIRVVADHEIRIQRMEERGDTIDHEALAFEEKTFIPDELFAYELNNNGTLEELQEQIQDLIEKLIYQATLRVFKR